jgi:hypothetical protein
MGDVEKVEVGLPRKGWSTLLKKFTPLLGSRELPKNKLLVLSCADWRYLKHSSISVIQSYASWR